MVEFKIGDFVKIKVKGKSYPTVLLKVKVETFVIASEETHGTKKKTSNNKL
jgi:hypothetical protein